MCYLRTPPHRLSADDQRVARQHKPAWGWLQVGERTQNAVGVLGEDERLKTIIEKKHKKSRLDKTNKRNLTGEFHRTGGETASSFRSTRAIETL